MDSYRLPKTVIPNRYRLHLAPDLNTCTFSGEETVDITVLEPTSNIVLNAADLEITQATIANPDGLRFEGTITIEESYERCRVTFPATLCQGPWHLSLAFKGSLNDTLRGFYRSTYKDQAGTSRILAATQFEATDARRAFPCWDEPALKAVFATSLAIDPNLTAVSNTAVASERMEGGKKIVTFQDTIPMSTYLVAFIVGKIEASEPVKVGATPLKIWAVPGKGRLTVFGQEIAAFSLRFFEEYYGLPYPGDKLDLLAIPDFASGAMENLGAITFRETALLVDQKTATHGELERIADVVSHENAHMWFGDLVTMSWWNGLWLNEAFATFMEMLAVDAWKPEWDRWTTFGVSRAAAFSVDGLHSTRPIEYPVQAPQDADAMFDVLTYEKGASVLRMLEQYVGPEMFREGVRDYLRNHAYGNADTTDLWAALGRASGQPVPALMDRWIFGEGYPLVTVEKDQGSRITLRQQRFTYLPSTSLSDASAVWQIPIHLRFIAKGKTLSQRLLLTQSQTSLEVPDGFESVLLNEGGHGFYRVRYSPGLLRPLLEIAPSGLNPIERFNVVSDAWAATLAGLIPLEEYLGLTERFVKERDKNVWTILIDSFHMLNRTITPKDRPGLEALVRNRLSLIMADVGKTRRSGESALTGQLRGDIFRALGTIGNDTAAQASAKEVYHAAQNNPDSLDPNVFSAAVAILAHNGDGARHDEFTRCLQEATTPQEERRYLYALAAFQPAAQVEETLARTVKGAIRSQDAPFVISTLLMSVHGRIQAWEFVKSNWDTMNRIFPKQGLRRMCGGVIGLATPELELDVRDFFESRKVDLGGKILAQYLEQLHIAVTFRERNGTTLSRYLASLSSS